MNEHSLIFDLATEAETAELAVRFGKQLETGDVVLLEGDIGTGKTCFARHLIQSQQRLTEDVPSPSFTLVQVYDTKPGQIWHADLYRLSSPDDVEELGLSDAFQTAICLIEWPDRLGELAPEDALLIRFELGDTETARTLTFSWQNDRWANLSKAITT